MFGSISTYLPEKNYGFIKGDDGKDYFFHTKSFVNKQQIPFIAEEARVSFDQQATPRGYRASKCRLLSMEEDIRYTVPEKFLISKNSDIKGWETIETGAWFVLGSGDSPDAAKDEMIRIARQHGANALLNTRYSKSTGEEPSHNGNGTHYFTIHHYEGTISIVGKRNVNGQYRRENLQGINRRLEDIYNRWLEEEKNCKEKKGAGLGVGIFLTFMMFLIGLYILAIICGILTFAWIMLWEHKPLDFNRLEQSAEAKTHNV